LSRSKFHSKGERSIVSILKVYYLNDNGVHDFEKRMIISKLFILGPRASRLTLRFAEGPGEKQNEK
jgi:hypothetical protein